MKMQYKMRKINTRFILGLLILLAGEVIAKVEPASVFTNNMVLQADKNIVVWGTADVNEAITVSINGVSAKTKGGTDGKWKVELPAMTYGGPYKLKFIGNNTLSMTNVMIGEVWICAGQSNMRQPVRNSINAKEEIGNAKYKNIRFLTIPLDGSAEPKTKFNAKWVVCSKTTVANKTATGYFFGRKLHEDLDVAIGLIDVSYGGATIFTFMDKETIENTVDTASIYRLDRANRKKFQTAMTKWESNGRKGYKPTKVSKIYNANFKQWKEEGRKGVKPFLASPNRYSSLCYNAMVHPLVPFSVKGAIWYQGEANTSSPESYVKWFGDYINMMRKHFNNTEMPYYFVQLAGFENQPNTKVLPETWAKFRLGQEQCLKHPFTGMITAMDIGEKKNIHPKNKQEVGRRFALSALHQTYGKTEVVYQGPTIKTIDQKGKKLLLTFEHCEGGLKNNKKKKLVSGFSAVLNNGKVVALEGEIKSSNTIEIKVSEVKRLRYAYANYPDCPLYNGKGLPALSFDKEIK